MCESAVAAGRRRRIAPDVDASCGDGITPLFGGTFDHGELEPSDRLFHLAGGSVLLRRQLRSIEVDMKIRVRPLWPAPPNVDDGNVEPVDRTPG